MDTISYKKLTIIRVVLTCLLIYWATFSKLGMFLTLALFAIHAELVSYILHKNKIL